MNRGNIYRIANPPGGDPKRRQYYVVVSRDALIVSKFSTVICAPIYSVHHGLATQVAVGIVEGLKHDSSIHCDALMSIQKVKLTHYVGHLAWDKLRALDRALGVALDIYPGDIV